MVLGWHPSCAGFLCSRVRRWTASTRLSVKVSGLIGMAPRDGGTELLLVDGDQTLNEPHLPRLLAPANTVADESTPASGVDGDRVFWNLANQRATLISGASTGTTKVTGLRKPDEVLRPRADGGSHNGRDVDCADVEDSSGRRRSSQPQVFRRQPQTGEGSGSRPLQWRLRRGTIQTSISPGCLGDWR